MIVRLVVPRRADGGERDRLWAFCRAYWERIFPTWDIVEGHHDDGPFNRSAAINSGAAGRWDVAVILDGDVILDPELVAAGVDRVASTGRAVLPFKHRHRLKAVGTERILDGFQGSWQRWLEGRDGAWFVSGCVIVPRALWDRVGGFDERFEGWGGEDDAFHAACRALAGVDRLDGAMWHLHHTTSPWRDHRSALYRQAKALSDRYVANAGDAGAMRRLLAEPRTLEQVVVVCLTNGRRDTLAKTLHSADEMLCGPIGRKVIAADGCRPSFEGWDTVTARAGNYCAAVGRGLDVAIGSGQPWVFWLEDDFTFEEPVDLAAMQAAMDADPRVVQLSLMRQPWYEPEIAGGSVIASFEDGTFKQRSGWVEHRAYWTFNPMLTRRSLLASHDWPKRPPNSELRFGRQVFADPDAIAGIWGAIGGPPRVTHIGVERAGSGY